MKIWHILFFSFWTPLFCQAQNNLGSHLIIIDAKNSKTDSFKIENSEVKRILENKINEKIAEGYLLASIDSTVIAGRVTRAYVYYGPLYKFRKKGKLLEMKEVLDSLESKSNQLKASGYPFSIVKMDDLVLTDSILTGQMVVDSGAYVPISNIILDGNNQLGDRYFLQVSRLGLGRPFSREEFEVAKTNLTKLPYINLISSEVDFDITGATLTFFMDKVSSSTFDFLVGIVPKTSSKGYDIVGSLNLELINQLGSGEEFKFQFDKFEEKRQNLRTKLVLPYLGNLPFGLEGEFQLNKPDTSQTEIFYSAGLRYNVSGQLNFIFSYQSRQFLLGELNLDYIRQNGKLPDRLDFKTTQVGLKAAFTLLDYIFNPRRGWKVDVQILSGRKRILENADVYNLDWETDSISLLYSSLPKSTPAIEFNWNVDYFLPFGERSTLLIGTDGGLRFSGSTKLLSNESYRLGGYESIRGFNEESLLANRFGKGLLEYRLIIDKNSNFYVFTEFSHLEKDEIQFNTLSGGVGMNFETKIGIFGITFANGNELGNGLNLKNTKVHFGIQSRF